MTDLLITLIFGVLATYRIARLLALEEGPGGLLDDLRNLYVADTWIGRGIRCPLCIGFWLAVMPAAAIGWSHGLPVWQFTGLWFAIAGGQAALHEWVTRND